MVTGFAQGLSRDDGLRLHSADPELCEEAERIPRQSAQYWSNFLYYTLKKYMQTPAGRDLLKRESV